MWTVPYIILNAVREAFGRRELHCGHGLSYREPMARKASRKLPLTLAVAAVIRRIPRGKVSTYGAVAEAAGYPRNARHVSKVLNQVPGLPWHRVLGSGGRISLRGEYGLEQRFL